MGLFMGRMSAIESADMIAFSGWPVFWSEPSVAQTVRQPLT